MEADAKKRSLSETSEELTDDTEHFDDKNYKRMKASSMVISSSTALPESGRYNKVAQKMMSNMGYVEGSGLGKQGQGRQNIIETSQQKGRRGLGFLLETFAPTHDQWDFDKDEVCLEEEIDWMVKPDDELPPLADMREWMEIRERKEVIDDETNFCDAEALQNVLRSKSVFDRLEEKQMVDARAKSNVYETIKGAFFQNRAAMKMANMDKMFDSMFTSPVDENGESLVAPDSLFYFADICAGPGGFSEYVLWRRKPGTSKGFGLTLRELNDFKLHEFCAAHSEFFEPHYGVDPRGGDGDIYNPANQEAFADFVRENSDGVGVHVVMADGGFSVSGQENIQEILSKRLYLCQFLVALSILRPDGHFVCKLFDLFTPFSAGLVFLMRHCFREVCVVKPVTSRPANSERYIVCKWKLPDTRKVVSYFCMINETLGRLELTGEDVSDVVPLYRLMEASRFYGNLCRSNNAIAHMQAIALLKIETFAKNVNLLDHRQSDTRDALLKKWNVPDEPRPSHIGLDPAVKFTALMQEAGVGNWTSFCSSRMIEIENLSLCSNVYNYVFVMCAGQRQILLGCGRSVYGYDGSGPLKMSKVEGLEMPRNTIVEAEIVVEYRGEGKGQRKINVIHIIDGICICGDVIQHLPYSERLKRLRMFVRAFSRPTRTDLTLIRVKDEVKCTEIVEKLSRMAPRRLKSGRTSNLFAVSLNDKLGSFFCPSLFLLVRITAEPWNIHYSKRTESIYFYDKLTKDSKFEMDCTGNEFSSYTDCLSQRLVINQSPETHCELIKKIRSLL